jgi:lactoylglutathione lyase
MASLFGHARHVKYLHTMVRVTDIEESIKFYRDALGFALTICTSFTAMRWASH